VQTCALPIFRGRGLVPLDDRPEAPHRVHGLLAVRRLDGQDAGVLVARQFEAWPPTRAGERDAHDVVPPPQAVAERSTQLDPRSAGAHPDTAEREQDTREYDADRHEGDLVRDAQRHTTVPPDEEEGPGVVAEPNNHGHPQAHGPGPAGLVLEVPAGGGVRGRTGLVHRPPLSSRSVDAAPSAAATASPPLSSEAPSCPSRSSACSSVSVVSTPWATGVASSSATRVSPSVTERHTKS